MEITVSLEEAIRLREDLGALSSLASEASYSHCVSEPHLSETLDEIGWMIHDLKIRLIKMGVYHD
jgi:hypothetical protein